MESTKNMEEYGNEVALGLGRFGCLPDDVLMYILDRIHDLKCLFQCTLVSKPFASKIHCIKSISLKLPAFDIDSTAVSTNIFHLSESSLRLEIGKISEVCPPPSPPQEPKFTKFLQKFTELECAFFESTCPSTPCCFPSLKWKVILGNSGPAVQMLVSVKPSNKCEDADNEFDFGESSEGEEIELELTEDDEESEDGSSDESEDHLPNGCLLFSLMSFAKWVVLAFSLIEQHHALKSVICTDSGKHGKIVLNGERIVEWRKRLLSGELSHNPIPLTISTGWVPLSGLPLLDTPAEGASFVLMNFLPGLHYTYLKRFEYDEDEEMVADAMNGVLTKHNRNISSIIRPWNP